MIDLLLHVSPVKQRCKKLRDTCAGISRIVSDSWASCLFVRSTLDCVVQCLRWLDYKDRSLLVVLNSNSVSEMFFLWLYICVVRICHSDVALADEFDNVKR